ncbi:membrane peptidoglycan carboxypeptidase [Terracoccus luteus]|uniref:Membrane peptidoglycan carboxypeptidase n=1 Tax=Terracoccus luteus TaxID=53356 RepID=A0A495Y2C6_9MICO|nr:transglycosylase domain-containing protein [Terracoccus luteus]RKT79565.1 membrane peptidoglycan carboxypeptidase [Terracoccus luteus]
MEQLSQSTRATKTSRRAQRPKRTGWRRALVGTLKWGSLTALVLVVLGAIGVFVAYQRTTIPAPNELADKQVSIVYYADGKTELDRIAPDNANRESVPLSKVPKAVQEAHLAAEDRSFYENNGISVGGILRAVKTSITGEAQVGGSTITQQYVKNYFLSQDRTISRKAREILIAVKIDSQYSKDQILEDYLNTIYYGRGAYGIQSAAKAYFNKDVSQLTVPEGAVLASVINAPSLFDPALGEAQKENLQRRYAYVLDGMVTEGWLSAADRAKDANLPKIAAAKANGFGSGTTGYITAVVTNELTRTGLTDAEIERGGLRITTTIQKTSQDAAVEAMKDNLPEKVTGGLVAMKPGDGAVVAMYGGADYRKSQLNTATQAILQGASNFKPFAVLAAVRDGVSTKTRFDGDQPQEIDGTRIVNFGGISYGMVDMRRMIGRSINTAFVNLNNDIGPAKTRQAAIDAGIPANTKGLDDSLTNVLGSASPHVVDMATAYSTIASQGLRTKAYVIKKVTSTTDDFQYDAKPEPVRAFDADVTADVTNAMTYTVRTGGTATKLQRLDRPIAGKTGTSSASKSIWFSGFVPQLAVSIGMYKPDANGNALTLTDSEDTNLTGGTIPADVFYDFMQVALENLPVEQFPDRVGVGDNDLRPVYTPPATQRPTFTQQQPTNDPSTPSAEPSPSSPEPTTSTPEPSTTAPEPTTTQPPAPTSTRPPQPTSTRPPEPTSTRPPQPTSTRPQPTTTRTNGGRPTKPANPGAPTSDRVTAAPATTG